MAQKGTLKWFKADKGYGFIKPDDNGEPDVFLHKSALEKSGLQSVRDGARYEYETEPDKKTGKEKVAWLQPCA